MLANSAWCLYSIASIVSDKMTNEKDREAFLLLEKFHFLRPNKTYFWTESPFQRNSNTDWKDEHQYKCPDNNIVKNIRRPLTFQKEFAFLRLFCLIQPARRRRIHSPSKSTDILVHARFNCLFLNEINK